MCTPIPAQVISIDSDTALVDNGGRQVTVSYPGPAGVRSGDWVLVYLGQVVGRLSQNEANALQELLQAVNSL